MWFPSPPPLFRYKGVAYLDLHGSSADGLKSKLAQQRLLLCWYKHFLTN